MPTTFRAANIANMRERKRLSNLIGNLKSIKNVNNTWTAQQWQNEFHENNIPHFQALYEAKKRDPEAYKIPKLRRNLLSVNNRRLSRLAMYGYVPRKNSSWVYKGVMLVPPTIPYWEAPSFRRVGKGGPGAGEDPLPAYSNLTRWRNAFVAEGTLKAPSGKKPVPFIPKTPRRGFLPTLKELAWATKTANENFETMKTMNNKQLKLFSKHATVNWTLLKPKRRASPLPANNVTEYRRGAAARVIQRAVKKYVRAKANRQASRGFLLRTNSQRARNMQRLQRAAGPANNTRVTWTRRANGTINRHKTLENLNLNLSKNQRNALNKMSETNAIAYIRNLARAH